ncbi:MAG: hypothetical protein EP314_08420 [Bacteroidetes bacterium]|nr:MAG: hypothetical protein EP314_08420 [Bacteroidota bacterium]
MIRALPACFLFCLLFWGESMAQQYNFKRYSVDEGLPRSGVYCLLEDSRGFLWIGTDGGGLSRFDGADFVNYTTEDGLADNTIRCMFEDATGNLWVGTSGFGLSRFDGHAFRTYSTANGLSSDYIRCITQDEEGNIWAGTFGGGINRLQFLEDSLSVTVFGTDGPLKHSNVRAAIADTKGALWFGTDAGLCVLQNDSWQCSGQRDGLADDRVLTLFEDPKGHVWAGTENGVSQILPDTIITYRTENGLVEDRVRAICADVFGNMWFGTGDGASMFDGKTFRTFSQKNGLSNNRIRQIILDRSGDLWFATNYGGICRYVGEEFIRFTETDGISSNQVLSTFLTTSGSIWLGTLQGMTSIRQENDGNWIVDVQPLEIDLSDHSINAIEKHPDGSAWLGTDKGILICNGTKTNWFEADGGSFNENVKCLLFEGDSSVWVGTSQGVTRFRKSYGAYVFDQYHSQANFNESEVSDLHADAQGRIWIGYINSRAVIYNGGEFVHNGFPAELNKISSFAQHDDGSLWIATRANGLFRFPPGTDVAPENFQKFSIENGLSSNDLHQLLFESKNTLWVGTVAGIDRIELKRNGDIASVTHYGRSEGFGGVETNENAICRDNDGNIWFGTIDGVVRLRSSAGIRTRVAPKLHITSVRFGFESDLLNMERLSTGTTGYFGLPQELRLPYAANNLSISFDAIDLRSPEKVRYQWRLEGYSDEWSVIDREKTVQLTNIPSGNHVFEVRAIGSSGVWTEPSAKFAFRVLPPFYFTWWFIVLASLLFIGIIYLIIKLREKRLVAEREKLQRLVDARTVELRQEKERSDELLLNILPHETAEELKRQGYASVQKYEQVSVLFTDFVGFTNITEGITHEELVRSLDEHFRMFDEVMDKFGIEKIKTIGDAYMAAGGIPTRTVTNPLAVVAAGLEMIHRLRELNAAKLAKGENAWHLRLGVHTGSVISGVVGKNKFAFDIWGDAVNTAARMESSGEVMKVNVSGSTYELIKEYFECTPRGKVKAKNKGEIEMYFVDRLRPQFSGSDNGELANATFMAILDGGRKNFATVN